MNGVVTAAGESSIYHDAQPDYASQRQPVVLLADGDDGHRAELRELLDLYNVGVLETRSGEEAIDLIVGENPDLAILSADLPQLDGYEVTRLIRNIKSLDRMPIVIFSAETERLFRKRAFDAGGDGFHIAPLDFERLDYILENYLFRAEKVVCD